MSHILQQLFRKKSVEQILKNVASGDTDGHESLGKHLGVRDLAAFGIAAIIGAGIFSTIGTASADGGPAVIFLFLFTAVACGFAAFAYAEFASMVPVSGSAYTYAYVAFGELMAWIIGWALIMEYAIGNITVAISWSDYFTSFLEQLRIPFLGLNEGISLPYWMQMDYFSAKNGFAEAQNLLASGTTFHKLPETIQATYYAYKDAPTLGGFHIVADLPALLIIVLITALVYKGMKESKNASNLMVVIKLAIILLVIAVGVFYIDTKNWTPFAPNGVSGILKGVSAVFFAYIGFDAISTTAEECKDPQRDLPRGMMWAIIICTILYMVIALILTGMVNYTELNVGDPLAYVFEKLNLKWMSGIIAVSAVFAMASVLLVFQMGQPRIWMSMSRDGLLPKRFAKIHPKFKTPSFSTIVVGFIVAIPALFLNLTAVTDLCSIGTLFAFVLVCAGVLVLQTKPEIPRGKFRTPYINGKWIAPLLCMLALIYAFGFNRKATTDFFTNAPQLNAVETIIAQLNQDEIHVLNEQLTGMGKKAELGTYLSSTPKYDRFLLKNHIPYNKVYQFGNELFQQKIPFYIFLIALLFLLYFTFKHNLSLIPLMGLISCLYMMSELSLSNWIGFGVWLLVGLIVYFGYSRKHSVLGKG